MSFKLGKCLDFGSKSEVRSLKLIYNMGMILGRTELSAPVICIVALVYKCKSWWAKVSDQVVIYLFHEKKKDVGRGLRQAATFYPANCWLKVQLWTTSS